MAIMKSLLLLAFALASLLGAAFSSRDDFIRQVLASQDSRIQASLPSMRLRPTFIISDPFSNMGSSIFSSYFRRPRYIFWSTDSYHKWTEWTNCRAQSCRRFRYRKCRRGRRCPSSFLVEMKACNDAFGCKAEKLNVTLEKQITKNCGLRPQMNLKILGGRPAAANSWPWQASLLLTNARAPSCGATLIGPRHVLTAAHCLVVASWSRRPPIGRKYHPRRGSVRIRLGDHDVRYSETHERVFDVVSIVIHPHFKLNIDRCKNDLALLKLNQSVPLHAHVNVACLPSPSMRLPSRRTCTALGWGVVKEQPRRSFWDFFRQRQQVRSAVLHEVQLPLVTYRECRREYPDFALDDASHVCAGGRGKDTCRGDSGGPLMCAVQVRNQTRWFLYGVTSFGSRNGCGNSYGVYSRVSHFTNWIKRQQRAM